LEGEPVEVHNCYTPGIKACATNATLEVSKRHHGEQNLTFDKRRQANLAR
jgi:hypothetical protein